MKAILAMAVLALVLGACTKGKTTINIPQAQIGSPHVRA